MNVDLIRAYADVGGSLPADGSDSIILDQRNLPLPPPTLDTDQFVITRGSRTYDPAFRVDHLEVHGTKRSFEALGLHLLALVLHGSPEPVVLRITNPNSDVTTLVASYGLPDDRSPSVFGLSIRPVSFEYFPSIPRKHPWLEHNPNVYSLPLISLTNQDDFVSTDEQWATRDVLRGFGTLDGTVRLAKLLLDASRPGNARLEFELESEAGFRGVAPQSAEIRFWLPGNELFREHFFPVS